MWDRFLSSICVTFTMLNERKEPGDPLTKPTKNPKPNKNVDHEQVRGDPCHSDIPEWLQEFRENLVDDKVPERRDSHASSSRSEQSAAV